VPDEGGMESDKKATAPSSEKTAWDKAAIVLQPVGGLLTALAVAFVGILGSTYLNRSQSQEAKLRLYTELMSRREQSDTSLREEMFKSIVGTFLTPSTARLEQKVLSLELLAYNFHESLELAPLFKHVRREVEESTDPRKAEYRRRLETVAKDVAGKQIEVLQENGAAGESGIDLEDLKAHPEGIRVFDRCFPLHSEEVAQTLLREQSAGAANPDDNPRCIRADVMEMDQQTQRLRVRLESATPGGENVDQLFWVDYYDLPMVANTHLSHDQRFAVVLRKFTETSAQLAFVYFSGSHAGLKDKPFYDDMLHQLELEPEPGGRLTRR
jgi:hypothetical protein